MRMKDLMSVPATAVAPGDSLHVADGIMTLGAVRHLPVVSGGRLVGVLSHRDILRAPGLLSPSLDSTRTVLKALRVEDVMSTPALTIGADASVQESAKLLLKNRVAVCRCSTAEDSPGSSPHPTCCLPSRARRAWRTPVPGRTWTVPPRRRATPLREAKP